MLSTKSGRHQQDEKLDVSAAKISPNEVFLLHVIQHAFRTTEDAAHELRNEEKSDSGHHAGSLVLDRGQPVCQRTAILI